MVKIIDGEIVADDDPRLMQRKQPQLSPGPKSTAMPQSSAQATPGGASSSNSFGSFDMNAPAFRTVDALPGQPAFLAGYPDAEVFGIRITCTMGLGMLLGFFLFGLKGLLIGAGLGYLYILNFGQSAQQQQGGGSGGGPMDILKNLQQQFMPGQGSGSSGNASGSRGSSAAGSSSYTGQVGSKATGGSGGAFSGSGRRLGSS